MTSHASTMEITVADSEAVLFLLSAESPSELGEALHDLQIQSSSQSSLQALALRFGRKPIGNCRVAILARTIEQLQQQLKQTHSSLKDADPKMSAGVFYGDERIPGKLAFLYPGQGSQFPGMMLRIAPMLTSVRTWLHELDAAYQSAGRAKPSEALHGADKPELFDLETGAQLGLTASLAMTEVIRSLGVVPDCMVGHSNGEHAALVAAGALGSQRAEEACMELARTSLLAARIAPSIVSEAMLAVAIMKRSLVDRFLAESHDGVYLAIDNSPSQIILAGTQDAMERAATALKPPAAFCTRLPFQRAYHTPLFQDWSALLDAHLQSVPKTNAEVPVYSAAHATTFPADAKTIRHWVATQWSSTVRFRETVERMYSDGVRLFIEVGPDAKLTAMARDTLRGSSHFAASASSSTQGEWMSLLQLCGRLYAAGREVKMAPVDAWRIPSQEVQGVSVPSATPFPVSRLDTGSFRNIAQQEHQRTLALIHAAELRLQQRLGTRLDSKAGVQSAAQPRLSGKMQNRERDSATFRVHLPGPVPSPYVLDHSMGTSAWGGQSLPVLAFTYTLAVALDAAGRILGRPYPVLEDVRAHRWLAMDCGTMEMEVRVNPGRIEIYALQDGNAALAFEALYRSGKTSLPPAFSGSVEGLNRPGWTPQRFYDDYAFHGPTYRLMKEARFDGGEVEAALEVLREADPGWPLDPALLDCAGQLAALWLLENGAGEIGAFPIALRRLEVAAPPPKAGTRIRCRGRVMREKFGITSLSLDFILPNGAVLYKLTGLQQKIVDFPPNSIAVLLGKAATPSLTNQAYLSTHDIAITWLEQPLLQFLSAQNGIWLRVLAHGVLQDVKLRDCYREQADTRTERLLHALVEQEATQRWRKTHAAVPEFIVHRMSDAIVGFACDKGKGSLVLDGNDAKALWRQRLSISNPHLRQNARVEAS